MAGDDGNPEGFDYVLDANAIDESSWITPQVEQYSQSQPHLGQFMPHQPSYQQYPAPTSYSTPGSYSTPYGTLQQSPYPFQSPYGNQFQPQSHVGDFAATQYGLSYSPAPTFSQSQQTQSHSPFSYSNHGMGDSTVSPQALQMNGAQSYPMDGGLSELQTADRASNANSQQFGSYDAGGGFGRNILQLNNELYDQQSHIPQEAMARQYSGGSLPMTASTSQSLGSSVPTTSYASQYLRAAPQAPVSAGHSSSAAVPATSYTSQYSMAARQAGVSTSQPSSTPIPTTSYPSQYLRATPQASIVSSQESNATVPTASYASQYSSTSIPSTSSTSPSSNANPPTASSATQSSNAGVSGFLSLEGAQIGPRNEWNNITPGFRFNPPESGKPFITIPDAPFLIMYTDQVTSDVGQLSKAKKSKSVKPKRGKDSLPGTSTTPSRTPKSTTSASKLKASKPPKVKDSKPQSIAAVRIKSATSPSPSLVSSSDEESSSDGYDSEDDMEITTRLLKELRGETRPSDPVTAAGWDATGIVFVPKHLVASREQIITATPEYERLIGGLREELKSINTDLSSAEAEKRNDDVEKLKRTRTLKRTALQNATSKAIESGHPDILKNLGNSQKLVNSLVSILIDCIKMEDYVGELPRSVLKLLSHFTTLNGELLKRVKFDAVEKRFGKKGDPELKGYISTIRSNTAEAEEKAKKAKEEAEKPLPLAAAPESSKSSKQQEQLKVATTSPLKRPHEADGANDLPNKKSASSTTTSSSGQKPLAPTTRQTNFFATLNRAGMKPIAKTSNSTVAAVIKKPETKTESAPAPPQSSLIAGLIASIEKPRELPKPVEAPKGPPETPEEKAKRERKESRRHLRVRWKDGDSLLEIKLFKHDKAEDEGRQDNMLRDAHDDRSEGMMLKQRIQEAIGDEDDEVAEIEYRPYPGLIPIDFSEMIYRDKDRWGDDYQQTALAKRGDNLSFSTPQQKIQQKRETIELMVVYTDPNDIPPTAKEPVISAGDEPRNVRVFGQPSEEWVVQRLQAIRQHELNPAMLNFSAHLTSTPDITAILRAMQGIAPHQPGANIFANLQNTTSTSPHRYILDRPTRSEAPKMDRKKADEECARIMKTLEQMAVMNKKYPADEPPEWMSVKRKQEWWEGLYRDKSNLAVQQKARDDAARILKMVGMMPTEQTQTSTYEPPPPSNSGLAAPHYDQGQLMSVVAALGNQNNQVGQSQPGNSAGDLSNLSQAQLQELLTGLSSQGSQGSQVPPPNGYVSFGLAQNQNTAAGLGMSQAELQNLLAGLGTQGNQAQNSRAQVQDPIAGLDSQTQAQLQSYIASLNNPNPQVQPQQHADFYAAWANASSGQNYNPVYNSQGQGYETQDYGKQSQTQRWESSSNSSSWKEQQRLNSKVNQDNHKRVWGGDHDEKDLDPRFPPGDARRGKKPCKFWGDGKCAKGNKCGYLHDGRGG